MSHVADVQMQVKDLDALKAVVEESGAVFHEGQKTHRWYGRFMNDWSDTRAAVNRRDPKTFGKCEHAISVPGVTYEIGVVVRQDGEGYDLVYDSFGSSGQHDGRKLEQKFGEGLTTLKQGYSVEVSKRELARKGYRVTTTVEQDGSIRVKAVR
jgi:hypothetical protein